jgi:hypothetical protein
MSVDRSGLLLFALVIVIAVAALSNEPAAAAPPTEWILKQNMAGAGPHTVYLSEEAVRVVNEMNGHEILCKGPPWTVYWSRPADKVGHSSSLEEAFRYYNFDPVRCEASAAEYKPTGHVLIDGVLVQKYENSSGGMWLAKDMNVSPKARELLIACYRLKMGNGVLIKYSTANNLKSRVKTRTDQWGTLYDYDGKFIDYLTTKSIKLVPFSPNDFQVPTNFRTVPVNEIFTSKTQTKAWESLLDDMKVGEKFEKSKK